MNPGRTHPPVVPLCQSVFVRARPLSPTPRAMMGCSDSVRPITGYYGLLRPITANKNSKRPEKFTPGHGPAWKERGRAIETANHK
jgi:hypothetical protein